MLTFNAFAIPPAITGILLFGLGLFVGSQRSGGKESKFLSFFCFSLTLWLLGYTMMYFSPSPEQALFWARIGVIGIILIPPFTLSFTYAFLNKKSKILQFTVYLLSFFSLLLSNTPMIYPGVAHHFWGYYPTAGYFYPIILLSFAIAFTTAVWFLFFELKNLRRINNKQRYQQVKFVFIGFLVGCTGSVDYIIKFGVPLYPFGYIAALIFTLSMTYGILRYRLLDITVIIRRTVIFAGLLAFVFTVFSAAAFLVQAVLNKFFGASDFWTYGISLFFIVLGYDPIRNLLVNLTDKYLFQKKYDYQKILKDATKGMSKIESLEHLLGLVIHFVTMKMRVKNCAVMMRRRDHEFELGAQRGYEKSFLEYRLDDTNPMISYLLREKEAIDMEHVKEYIQEGNRKRVKGEAPHEYDFHAIQLTMEELHVACAVPSFLGHDLKSILLIGEKKSGDFFTTEDLSLLFTLAQESAIAIENAKLFDEAVNKSNQLAKINEQLEYSRNLLMKALRETEVANKQLQDTQAQLIHEQKMATLGRLAASVGHEVNNPLTILSMNVSRAILKYRKNPDLKVGEVLDLFQKMEQNIGRIKAVVNTLTGLLKKSEKGKFEPLSLKLVLEETLPLVQFQTYLDNLSGTEVEFDIPGSTPLIRGDLERLQEVFLNLFINAYHAMQGRRNRRIRVTAEADAENPARVAVNFTDNGSGMTEEIMKKIFNYGFTTKPPGRGSGMGLYMCKYIIELHGGDIRVKSKLGEGTTFTICLPSYEEGGESTAGLRLEASS